MICVDESGPLQLRPVGGATWAPKKHPDRQPATYRRPHGVRHMFSCSDLEGDKLYASIKPRKRRQEFLAFLKTIRKRYPMETRLYIVRDNFSPHLHHRVRTWARKNRVSLVFTPTNASWLNRIECHFGVLRRFVLHNSYYQSHEEMGQSIHRYIRWRNANAKDKGILRIQKRYDFS